MAKKSIKQKILAVLADGQPHARRELLACLGDSQAKYVNLNWHITTLRNALRKKGQDIICELYRGRGIRYRLIKLFNGYEKPRQI